MSGNNEPVISTKRRRMKKVAAQARIDFSKAIDLVLVHNEREVKGAQPRASLNPHIVLTAVSSWERLVHDTNQSLTVPRNAVKPHRSQASSRKSSPAKLATLPGLSSLDIVSNWRGNFAFGWTGKHPVRWEFLSGTQAGQKGGLTISQHVDQWISVRHGVAHQALPQKAHQAQNGIAANKAVHGKGRAVIWTSSSGVDTIQSGAARACLVEMLQVADCTLRTVAESIGLRPSELGLPGGWFESELPTHLARGYKGGEPRQLWGEHYERAHRTASWQVPA